MPALLVVDDESSILMAFRRAYRNHEMEVLTAETAAAGLAIAREQRPDVIIFDIQLPDMSGLDALRQLRAIDARSPVIFITGKSTTDTAIEAMKLGAFEYLLKPLELAQLRQVIDRALAISRMMHVPAVVAEMEPVDDRADAIIGRCPAMQEVYKAIGRVAASSSGMSAARSPAPIGSASASSSNVPVGRSSLMKWPRFLLWLKVSSFAFSRRKLSNAWGEMKPFTPTCGSWRPVIKTSPSSSNKVDFARTSIIA